MSFKINNFENKNIGVTAPEAYIRKRDIAISDNNIVANLDVYFDENTYISGGNIISGTDEEGNPTVEYQRGNRMDTVSLVVTEEDKEEMLEMFWAIMYEYFKIKSNNKKIDLSKATTKLEKDQKEIDLDKIWTDAVKDK